MRNKRTELFVGCFIVLGVLAFVYLAVQVSGLAFAGKKDSYQIMARFDDIGGLTSRAKVTIAGVAVGNVESISFDKELYMGLVKMNINSDVDNPQLKNKKIHSCVSKGNLATLVGHFAFIIPPGLV